jgi:hypothetical protein
MAACPKGHESETTDYCDVCGAAMTPTPSGQPPGGAPSSPRTGAVPSSPAARPAGLPAVCPECQTPMTGRFCEVDGFDALAVPSPGATSTEAATAAMNVPAPRPDPSPGASSGSTPAGFPGAPSSPSTPSGAPSTPWGASSAPSGASSAPAAPLLPADVQEATLAVSTVTAAARPLAGPATNGTATAPGWHVVVSADRAHFDRVEAWNGPDPTISFPRFCPPRRFPLTGEQVLIGRRSRSRGSYPDIDLAGPPEDAAVSHLHALLVAQPDGGWAVVDLRSANCTFVNDAADPIQPELPVPLADGDHIHVGSFTRITLHATPL